MPKLKTLYICQQCAYQSVRWIGRCPSCDQWNTMVEEVVEAAPVAPAVSTLQARPTILSDVALEDTLRLSSGLGELNRVLGGGIVAGSAILVGGEPGIGKSTLLLSAAGSISASGKKVLYVSGEESLRQTKLRATRLGLSSSNVHLLSDTRLEMIAEAINQLKPDVAIIDSIQVIEMQELDSAPGSIGQVRACAHELVGLVKAGHSALFLVGHITKDGSLAGPKALEHLVDTVLYFEGEPTTGLRLLRSTKNRFGATYELGVFHMTAEGLVEVSNASELFLGERAEAAEGCMVTVILEGSRSLLVEVQALTSPCGMGLPRRRTTGVDPNRVSMLLAVLEQRVGLRELSQHDVFVSSLGGVRLLEPASDLGVALAIASSIKGRAARRNDLAIGEVGLTGEVRPVMNVVQRLNEARRIGFTRCWIAAQRGLEHVEGIEVISVRHVKEAVNQALANP